MNNLIYTSASEPLKKELAQRFTHKMINTTDQRTNFNW